MPNLSESAPLNINNYNNTCSMTEFESFQRAKENIKENTVLINSPENQLKYNIGKVSSLTDL